MITKRIIPCLDVRDGRVVKGVNFVNIRDAGDPVELARFYSDQGADEIVFLDITATSDGRATVADVVERTAEQVFVPLTVGGGIGTPERAADFLTGIERMISDLVEGYRAIQADTALFDKREPIGKCPRCGKDVVESKLSFQCIDRSCGFTMWKNSRFFTDKHKELTKAVASALLKKGRVKMTGLFSEKKGVAYDATVVLDDTGKYVNYKVTISKDKQLE